MSARHQSAAARTATAEHDRPVSVPVVALKGFQLESGHVVIDYRGKYDLTDQKLAIPVDHFDALFCHVMLARQKLRGLVSGAVMPDHAQRAPGSSGNDNGGSPQ